MSLLLGCPAVGIELVGLTLLAEPVDRTMLDELVGCTMLPLVLAAMAEAGAVLEDAAVDGIGGCGTGIFLGMAGVESWSLRAGVVVSCVMLPFFGTHSVFELALRTLLGNGGVDTLGSTSYNIPLCLRKIHLL